MPPRALPHRLSPSAGSLNIEALHLGFTIPPLPSDRLDRRPSWSRRRGHISQDGGLGSRTHTPSIRMTSIAGLDPFFLDRHKGPRRMSERSERVRPGTIAGDRANLPTVTGAPIRRPSSPRSGVFSYGGKEDVQSDPASEAQPERHQPQLYASFFPS